MGYFFFDAGSILLVETAFASAPGNIDDSNLAMCMKKEHIIILFFKLIPNKLILRMIRLMRIAGANNKYGKVFSPLIASLASEPPPISLGRFIVIALKFLMMVEAIMPRRRD